MKIQTYLTLTSLTFVVLSNIACSNKSQTEFASANTKEQFLNAVADDQIETADPKAPDDLGGSASTPPRPGASSTPFEQQGCRAESQSISVVNYDDIFAGPAKLPFPAFNRNIRLSQATMGGAKIVSLRFVSNRSIGTYASFGSSMYPTPGDAGAFSLSISKTPGCMDVQKLPAGCTQAYIQNGEYRANNSISWIMGASPVSWRCSLTAGETYYLNIHWDKMGSADMGRDFATVAQ